MSENGGYPKWPVFNREDDDDDDGDDDGDDGDDGDDDDDDKRSNFGVFQSNPYSNRSGRAHPPLSTQTGADSIEGPEPELLRPWSPQWSLVTPGMMMTMSTLDYNRPQYELRGITQQKWW